MNAKLSKEDENLIVTDIESSKQLIFTTSTGSTKEVQVKFPLEDGEASLTLVTDQVLDNRINAAIGNTVTKNVNSYLDQNKDAIITKHLATMIQANNDALTKTVQENDTKQSTNLTNSIDSLKSNVYKLIDTKKDVDSMDLSNLTTDDKTDLVSSINSVNDKLVETSDSVTSLTLDVNSLKEQIGVLPSSTEFTQLQNKVDNLPTSSNYQQLGTSVGEAVSKVTELDKKLAKMVTTDVTDAISTTLSTKADSTELTKYTPLTTFEPVNESVNGLVTKVDTNTSDIENIKQDLTNVVRQDTLDTLALKTDIANFITTQDVADTYITKEKANETYAVKTDLNTKATKEEVTEINTKIGSSNLPITTPGNDTIIGNLTVMNNMLSNMPSTVRVNEIATLVGNKSDLPDSEKSVALNISKLNSDIGSINTALGTLPEKTKIAMLDQSQTFTNLNTFNNGIKVNSKVVLSEGVTLLPETGNISVILGKDSTSTKLDFGNLGKVINLATPQDDGDAVTLKYLKDNYSTTAVSNTLYIPVTDRTSFAIVTGDNTFSKPIKLISTINKEDITDGKMLTTKEYVDDKISNVRVNVESPLKNDNGNVTLEIKSDLKIDNNKLTLNLVNNEEFTNLKQKVDSVSNPINIIGTADETNENTNSGTLTAYVKSTTVPSRDPKAGDMVFTNDNPAYIWMYTAKKTWISMGRSGVNVASRTQLGVIKGSDTINIAGDGVASVGSTVMVESDVDTSRALTWEGDKLNVKLASNSQLGVVKIGNNISVDGDGSISIPVSSNSVSGVVRTGDTIKNSVGTIDIYEASDTQLGGIKVGTGFTYDDQRRLCVAAVDYSNKYVTLSDNEQTINGNKTFANALSVGNATSDSHAVNVSYVNSNLPTLTGNNTLTGTNTFNAMINTKDVTVDGNMNLSNSNPTIAPSENVVKTLRLYNPDKGTECYLNLDFNNKGKIVNLPDPVNNGDGVNLSYLKTYVTNNSVTSDTVDSKISTALSPVNGSISAKVNTTDFDSFKDTVAKLSTDNNFTGDNTFTKVVSGVDPTESAHLTTKNYVDSKVDSGRYTLPVANDSTLGGVKQGNNITISTDGTLSVATATNVTLGLAQAGEGLHVDNGVLSISQDEYLKINREYNATILPTCTFNNDVTITSNHDLNIGRNMILGSSLYLGSTEAMLIPNTDTTSTLKLYASGNRYTSLDLGQTSRINNLPDPVSDREPVHKLYANTNYVGMSGDQTVTGVKTFSNTPKCSNTPSNNDELVNKKYVDDAITNSGVILLEAGTAPNTSNVPAGRIAFLVRS